LKFCNSDFIKIFNLFEIFEILKFICKTKVQTSLVYEPEPVYFNQKIEKKPNNFEINKKKSSQNKKKALKEMFNKLELKLSQRVNPF